MFCLTFHDKNSLSDSFHRFHLGEYLLWGYMSSLCMYIYLLDVFLVLSNHISLDNSLLAWRRSVHNVNLYKLQQVDHNHLDILLFNQKSQINCFFGIIYVLTMNFYHWRELIHSRKWNLPTTFYATSNNGPRSKCNATLNDRHGLIRYLYLRYDRFKLWRRWSQSTEFNILIAACFICSVSPQPIHNALF